MLCARCKTVETIRITYPVNRCTDSRGRYLAQSVERCPCCDLQWSDVPIDYAVASLDVSKAILEYQCNSSFVSPGVRSIPVQITLF